MLQPPTGESRGRFSASRAPSRGVEYIYLPTGRAEFLDRARARPLRDELLGLVQGCRNLGRLPHPARSLATAHCCTNAGTCSPTCNRSSTTGSNHEQRRRPWCLQCNTCEGWCCPLAGCCRRRCSSTRRWGCEKAGGRSHSLRRATGILPLPATPCAPASTAQWCTRMARAWVRWRYGPSIGATGRAWPSGGCPTGPGCGSWWWRSRPEAEARWWLHGSRARCTLRRRRRRAARRADGRCGRWRTRASTHGHTT